MCEISASGVTLRSLSIKGCNRDSSEGVIVVDNASKVTLKNMVFENNNNTKGPSCVSGQNSEVTLRDITASGNQGGEGGFLGMVDSNVLVAEGKFHNNSAQSSSQPENGGTLSLKGPKSNLNVERSSFSDNKCMNNGGAISLKVQFAAFLHEKQASN